MKRFGTKGKLEDIRQEVRGQLADADDDGLASLFDILSNSCKQAVQIVGEDGDPKVSNPPYARLKSC